MITYKPVKLPAGPIKVAWQSGLAAWVVQLPNATGFSYFESPNGRDTKAGLAALRRAIISAAEMATYKKRALWIGADEQLVKQAMGKSGRVLRTLTSVRYLGMTSKRAASTGSRVTRRAGIP